MPCLRAAGVAPNIEHRGYVAGRQFCHNLSTFRTDRDIDFPSSTNLCCGYRNQALDHRAHTFFFWCLPDYHWTAHTTNRRPSYYTMRLCNVRLTALHEDGLPSTIDSASVCESCQLRQLLLSQRVLISRFTPFGMEGVGVMTGDETRVSNQERTAAAAPA